MNRDELLKRITMLDFMTVDLDLYLNTHPNDVEAIKKYNEIATAAKKFRAIYEDKFGPLVSYRSINMSPDKWQWCEDPWPWAAEYNFCLEGK